MNKRETTDRILSLGTVRSCTKLALDNILFPNWSDWELMGKILRQCVRTKEQPEGYVYPEGEYQVVMRIIGGKLLIDDKPDAYCWSLSKVQKWAQNGKVIGFETLEAFKNLNVVLNSITDPKEQDEFFDMVKRFSLGFLVVHTEAESRECIVVTQELYDQGVTGCVDSWVKPDKNGEGPETKLYVGDALIVEHKPEGVFVYRVGADEFAQTYSLN